MPLVIWCTFCHFWFYKIFVTRRYGVSDPTILAHGGPRPLLYRKENGHFVPGGGGGGRSSSQMILPAMMGSTCAATGDFDGAVGVVVGVGQLVF